MTLRFVTFTHQTQTRVGVLENDTIYALAWDDTLLALIRAGAQPSRTGETYALDSVKLEAPLLPGKIIAVGRNYAAHAKETGSAVPQAPLLFAKLPSAVIGQGDAITWRESITTQVDWEAELAVVIGKRSKDVPEAAAFEHIFGYTVANDVSARDLQLRTDGQWTRGKGLDTFCPLGPAVVTHDEIPDPQNLAVRTTLNGDLMQDSNTHDMVFTVPVLVAYISRMFTLEPGDVILTGTPEGVGEGRTPQVFMKDGDVVAVSVSSVGTLTNPCYVLSD